MAAERVEADAEALPIPDPKRGIAKLINYVGNGVIMAEILLMVSISVALMLHVRVLVGVVLVLYAVPAFVMILLLTNDLKKQLEHKCLRA